MITRAEIERLLGPWQCQLGSVFMWWSIDDRHYAECRGPIGGNVVVGRVRGRCSRKRVSTIDELRAELERVRWFGVVGHEDEVRS